MVAKSFAEQSDKRALRITLYDLPGELLTSRTGRESLLDQEENLDNEYNSIRPRSWIDSAVYGYTETFKEQAIEMYGGALGGKVLSKAMGWVGKTKLGKFASRPTNITTKAYKAISNTYKEGADRIGNSLIGKISSKAAYRTGSSQVVSGIPGEVFEEIGAL